MTRSTLNPTEIFDLLYQFYIKVMTTIPQCRQDEKWRREYSQISKWMVEKEWVRDKAKKELDESIFKDFNAFTNEKLVEFFSLKPTTHTENNLNGLWLIFWYIYETGSMYGCDSIYERLPKKLTEFSDELFTALNFNVFCNGINTNNLSTLEMIASASHTDRCTLLIFERISLWPESKIKDLCWDAHHRCDKDANNMSNVEGGLFIYLADKLPIAYSHNDNYRLIQNFIRLFSLFPAYTDNKFYNSIVLKTQWTREDPYHYHWPEGLSFLLILNRLKCCAEKSLPFKDMDKEFSEACVATRPFSSDSHFLLAEFIRTLSINEETLTAEIEQLKIIKPSNICPGIYYQSQFMLANHFFTIKQVNLTYKLNALKIALSYAIKARFHDKNEDNQLILRIAEAYVCANQSNLNSNNYGVSLGLSEFNWIIEILNKMSASGKIPGDEALNEVTNNIIIHLIRQRNVALAISSQLVSETSKKIELGKQLNKVTKENAELIERVKLLEQQVDALIKANSLKKDMDGALYKPKLF
jgi:hypothetical protein